jgi:predicted dehydrogenase
MKSLIIGMNIGQLYKQVLSELDFDCITVDLNLPADYKFYQDAISDHRRFDTIHICTPNFTHENIANTVAKHTRFLFIEKPGFRFETRWKQLVDNYPDTRIMMVKNNMWRDNIQELRELYQSSNAVNLHWLNNNRVPKAGSWFTDKDLAYGGVSRDLLPHLLSLYAALEPNYHTTTWLYKHAWRRWELKDLTSSDYGEVNHNGVYDVDDNVELECVTNNHRWYIRSSWRTLKEDDIAIHFDQKSVPLGLCPESAYRSMIVSAIENQFDKSFWQKQLEIDLWIHRQINL